MVDQVVKVKTHTRGFLTFVSEFVHEYMSTGVVVIKVIGFPVSLGNGLLICLFYTK